MRRAWVMAAAAGLVLLLGAPAHAGGIAYLQLDEQVERNERLSADEVLYVKSKRALKERLNEGPFYAYLSPHVPGRNLRQAPPLPTGATKLGLVEVRDFSKIEGTKQWAARIGVDFTVPAVTPGSYRIDVCTDPCRRTIKDLYPSVTRVVSGTLEERLEERLTNMELDLGNAMHAGDGRIERRAKKALNGFREYTRELFDEQNTRVGQIEAALDKVRSAAGDKPFPTAVTAFAFAIGALLASAGWFFGSKLAHRASPGEKKVSALGGAV